MSTKQDASKNKAKKLKLNKETLKDLNPAAERVRGGGGKPAGTAPISDTCKTICHKC